MIPFIIFAVAALVLVILVAASLAYYAEKEGSDWTTGGMIALAIIALLGLLATVWVGTSWLWQSIPS